MFTLYQNQWIDDLVHEGYSMIEAVAIVSRAPAESSVLEIPF